MATATINEQAAGRQRAAGTPRAGSKLATSKQNATEGAKKTGIFAQETRH